jgi:hypothetical protein
MTALVFSRETFVEQMVPMVLTERKGQRVLRALLVQMALLVRMALLVLTGKMERMARTEKPF